MYHKFKYPVGLPQPMRNTRKSFQIVFPVYNEEKQLEKSIVKTLNFLESNHYKDYSILIADNLSTDETGIIGKNLTKRFKNVSYKYIPKKGVGIALKNVWSESDYHIIGYMDIDLSADLVHLEKAFKILNNNEADIVIGSRLRPNSKVERRTLVRELASRSYNFILRHYLGVKFTDAVCGFKFLKKEAFNKLIAEGIESDEWFFDTELLVKAEWNNLKIAEIAVHWRDSRDSKVDLIQTTIKYLKSIRKLKLQKK